MTRPLRVLIGCATSCVALEAFLARGHDAWQCDLLPADEPTNRHIRDDIRNVLSWGWNLLIVSNPPCTRLCRSGQRWLYGPGKSHPRKLPKGRTHASMIEEFDLGVEIFGVRSSNGKLRPRNGDRSMTNNTRKEA